MKSDTISKYEAMETGAHMMSQFQFGDFVTANPNSMTEPGDSNISGWVVGIIHTVSRVYYDLAEDLGNGVCRVHRRLRCFMRRESDGNETMFIRMEDAKEMLNSPLIEDKDSNDRISNKRVLH
ncbi:hypothetical protein GJX92_12925 [Salmonella enterica]|nr:hypothetical protein [Salmonella enterica]